MPQRTLGAAAKDVNLPDEDAGKPIGKLLPGEVSRDHLKQEYRERLRRRRGKRTREDDEREDRSDIIFGGDADDPRWPEYLGRRLRFAKTDDEAAAANRDIENHQRGGRSFYGEPRPTMMTLGSMARKADKKEKK